MSEHFGQNMTRIDFGGWEVDSDVAATRAAYEAMSSSGPEQCACTPCHNFVRARSLVYPPNVLELLGRLGINPELETEVYHNTRLRSGLHSYGGWFHFVGVLLKDPGVRSAVSPTFRAWFVAGGAVVPQPFQGLELVRFEFDAEIPWVLGGDYAT